MTVEKRDKYSVEGCQKSLCHPSWPPIIDINQSINQFIGTNLNP